ICSVAHASLLLITSCFFFRAEDGIRYFHVTGVQTCALPIWMPDSRSTLSSSSIKNSMREKSRDCPKRPVGERMLSGKLNVALYIDRKSVVEGKRVEHRDRR